MRKRPVEPGPVYDAETVLAAIEAWENVPAGCDGRCAAGEAWKVAAHPLGAWYKYAVFMGLDRALVDAQLRKLLDTAQC